MDKCEYTVNTHFKAILPLIYGKYTVLDFFCVFFIYNLLVKFHGKWE